MPSSIILSDQPTLKDQLGFGAFREALRRAIVGGPTPVTIGIFGDWGSGKTSLMRMLEDNLQGDHATAWFDAWKFSEEEVLSRALIATLIERLRELYPAMNKDAAENLEKLERNLYHDTEKDVAGSLTFDWRQAAKGTLKLGLSMLPVVGGSFRELLKQYGKQGKGGVESIIAALQRDRATVHRERVKFRDEFQQHFTDLVAQFVPADKRLIVFIDDLDRCLPEDAIRVLETIKLYLDAERCVYVVGVDSHVIERGIQVRYKDFYLEGRRSGTKDDPACPIEGSEYLEKLIQLPFHLPPIQTEDMETFVPKLYPGCPAGVAAACAAGLEANPRKVKRAVSIYRLLWDVASHREDLEDLILPELLAKLVVIQSRWLDDLFAEIKRTPEVLQVVEQRILRQKARRAASAATKDAPQAEAMPEGAADPDDEKESEVKLRPHSAEQPAAQQGRSEDRYEKYTRREPLIRLLTSGEKRFHELEAWQLHKYVYLASTTAPAEAEAKPIDRDLWSRLLSNDEALVRNACGSLAELEEAERADVVAQLVLHIGDERAELPQRLSAGLALSLLGDPRPGISVIVSNDIRVPDLLWCDVPGGTLMMGSSREDEDAYEDEYGPDGKPFPVEVASFRLAAYPVTYAQFRPFVETDGYTKRAWWTDAGWEWRKEGKRTEPPLWRDGQWHIPNHPVVGVTWYEAMAYCAWLTRRLGDAGLLKDGRAVRLPTEAEREWAGKGPKNNRYPWGDDWLEGACNSREAGIGRTCAVGLLPAGARRVGKSGAHALHDLAGNVWEWCATKWRGSYAEAEDNSPAGEDSRVFRGGGWGTSRRGVRCSSRHRLHPHSRNNYIGFRCAQ